MVPKLICGVILVAGLGGCAPALPVSAFSGGAPVLRPEAFFAGSTSSSGVIESPSGAPTGRFHVEGTGLKLADGTFRLVQTVTFDKGKPETRVWYMRPLDAHHYTATLSDASGTVEGEAYGDLFHLHYPMKTPFGAEMEQWMYLQPDGRTVMNEATVSLLGVTAAHLSERITHEDTVAGAASPDPEP